MTPDIERFFFCGFVFLMGGIFMGLLGIDPTVPGHIITGILFILWGAVMMLINKSKEE
jgi:hypothetical protein